MKRDTESKHVDRARVFGEGGEDYERIAPGFFDTQVESEHLARYRWAGSIARSKLVLDAACGTGYGTRLLEEAGASAVVGVDVHLPALEFAQSVYGVMVVLAEVQRLPIQDESVDLVVSMETIEHLAEPVELLKEAHRVLRPGGELLLSTPNSRFSGGHNPYHLHELTLAELEDCLATAGFRTDAVAGQCWRLRWNLPRQIWGVRHFTLESERRARVRPRPPGRSEPLLWCVRAKRL